MQEAWESRYENTLGAILRHYGQGVEETVQASLNEVPISANTSQRATPVYGVRKRKILLR